MSNWLGTDGAHSPANLQAVDSEDIFLPQELDSGFSYTKITLHGAFPAPCSSSSLSDGTGVHVDSSRKRKCYRRDWVLISSIKITRLKDTVSKANVPRHEPEMREPGHHILWNMIEAVR